MQRQKITNNTSVKHSLHELQEVTGKFGKYTHAYSSCEPVLRVRYIYFREKSGNCLTLARGFSTFSFIDMHVHKPSLHVSGKPRKELGFPCFPTVPKFPIPPICPRPPQRFLSGAIVISCRRFRAKKNLARNTCHTMALCVRGKNSLTRGFGEKKFLRKPNPPHLPPALKKVK